MKHQVKRSFLAAVAAFELGSLVCAVAPTSTSLIIGRALAGVGDGAIFAGAYTILASTGTGAVPVFIDMLPIAEKIVVLTSCLLTNVPCGCLSISDFKY